MLYLVTDSLRLGREDTCVLLTLHIHDTDEFPTVLLLHVYRIPRSCRCWGSPVRQAGLLPSREGHVTGLHLYPSLLLRARSDKLCFWFVCFCFLVL